MSREFLAGAVVVVLALGVLAAFGAGLTGTRTYTEVTDNGPLSEPPRDGSAGIVHSMWTKPHTVLGFKWGGQDQMIAFQMVVTPECGDLFEAHSRLTEVPEGCPAILATGEYDGSGISTFGDRLVSVRVDVSRECFDAVSYGDRWPHQSKDCADESSARIVE